MEVMEEVEDVNPQSTRELVQLLCDKSKSESDHTKLLHQAERMISAFEQKGSVRNDEDIAAIIHLAHIPDPNIISYIISSFARLACEEGVPPRLKVKLFVAMADAHRTAISSALKLERKPNQSDLINNLILISKTMNIIHKKDPDISYLVMMLRAFCRFTDSLFDAEVSGLDKELLKNPVYNMITSLTNHSDPEIQFLANYAQQGLVRVPSGESKSLRTLRRIRDLSKGLSALSDIAYTLTAAIMSGGVAIARTASIPNNVFNIIDVLKSVIHTKKSKEEWYMQLRLLDVVFSEIIASSDPVDERKKCDKAFDAEFLQGKPTIDFCEGFVYRLEEWLRHDPSAKDKVFFQHSVEHLFRIALSNDGSVWMAGRLSHLVNSIPFASVLKYELQLSYDVLSQEANLDYSETVTLLKTILALAITDPESVNDKAIQLLQNIYMKHGIEGFDKNSRLIVRSTVFDVLRYLHMYLPEGALSAKIDFLIKRLDALPLKKNKKDKEGVSQKRKQLLSTYVLKSQRLDEAHFDTMNDDLFDTASEAGSKETSIPEHMSRIIQRLDSIEAKLPSINTAESLRPLGEQRPKIVSYSIIKAISSFPAGLSREEQKATLEATDGFELPPSELTQILQITDVEQVSESRFISYVRPERVAVAEEAREAVAADPLGQEMRERLERLRKPADAEEERIVLRK